MSVETPTAAPKVSYKEAKRRIRGFFWESPWGKDVGEGVFRFGNDSRYSHFRHWTHDEFDRETKNFEDFFALADEADFPLIPTLEIDDVWHALMRREDLYRSFCQRVFGRMIEHKPMRRYRKFTQDEMENYQKTAKLFLEKTGRKYGEKSAGIANCGMF